MVKPTQIFIIGDHAFVETTPNYLLCIGTREQVAEVDAEGLWQMVKEALAEFEWRNLETKQQHTH